MKRPIRGVCLVLAVLVAVSSMVACDRTRAPPPEPDNFYGHAYASGGSPVPLGTTMTAWVDGVTYSNESAIWDTAGAYDLDVYGNYHVTMGDTETPEIKEGADVDDPILFASGDFTNSGAAFEETMVWQTGDTNPLDLHAAAVQPALLKIACIDLRSDPWPQSIWVHNPGAASVDLSTYYLKKDGFGQTNYSSWTFAMSGTVAPYKGKWINFTTNPLSPWGGDLEVVWENPGTAFGGNAFVVDRVEWNHTGGSGTHYWESSNTIASDASLGPVDRALWRKGFPSATLQDTNDNAADFTASYTSCPGDYPPAPPTMLPAVLTGPSLQDVTLYWSLSADDGTGEDDVSGYEIWTGTTYDDAATGYILLASLPAGTAGYVHAGAGVGDTSNHFYQVRAIEEVSGRFTPALEQAGKYTKYLGNGRQLISVPLEVADWDIDVVLQTLAWKRARTYTNPAGQGKNWWSNDKDKKWSDLETLDRKMAVWLELTSGGWWVIAGLVPDTTWIELRIGWNFIGYPSFTPKTVAELLAGIHYQAVEGYAPDPPYYLRRLSPSDIMSAGNGYWIHVSQDAVLKFQN